MQAVANQLTLDAAPTLMRFERHIRRDPVTGCWVWIGAVSGSTGYGKVKVAGKSRDAHRALYEHYVGPVPQGLELDHLCRNRPCVFPTHLEPVTRAENCRRGDHNQRRKTHCPKGHPYSGENLIIRTRRGSLSGRGCRECRRAQNRTRHRATELWALRRKAARLAHREQRRSGMTPTSGPIVKALLAAEAEAGA